MERALVDLHVLSDSHLLIGETLSLVPRPQDDLPVRLTCLNLN